MIKVREWRDLLEWDHKRRSDDTQKMLQRTQMKGLDFKWRLTQNSVKDWYSFKRNNNISTMLVTFHGIIFVSRKLTSRENLSKMHTEGQRLKVLIRAVLVLVTSGGQKCIIAGHNTSWQSISKCDIRNLRDWWILECAATKLVSNSFHEFAYACLTTALSYVITSLYIQISLFSFLFCLNIFQKTFNLVTANCVVANLC